MLTQLSSVRDIVVKLGGLDRVAGRCGTDEEHVRVWIRRGWFPTFTSYQIEQGLLEQDCYAGPDLFEPYQGMTSRSAQKNIFAATVTVPRSAFSDQATDGPR